MEELDDVLVPSDWEEELVDAERRGMINGSKRQEWELAILEHEHRKVHDMLGKEELEDSEEEVEDYDEEQSVMQPWIGGLAERPPNSAMQNRGD